MALPKLKTLIANIKNYGGKRATNKIKFIVIHFTANDGDSDEANAKYFKNNVVKASAHYFVDSDSITQSVPDNYVAYSVGGSKYSDCGKTGGGKYYGKCTNANSLSIELCDDNKNGKIYPSKKTIENALELTKSLMKKHNVPQENVIRHFDVNGKQCPAYWCGTDAKNKKWKTEFWNKLSSNKVEVKKENSASTSVSKSNSKVKSWQKTAIKDGFKFASGVDGIWGKECEAVAKEGIVKARTSNGKSVYKYQNLTRFAQLKIGMTDAQADGLCGKSTTASIKKWQKENGLTQDGAIGLNGWKKMLCV